MDTTVPKGAYGVDAPYLLAVPAVLFVGSLTQGVLTRSAWPVLGAAAIALAIGCGYYTSRHGKFVVWSRLLDGLSLRGDEQVLDVGCGRGAVLLLVARRLKTGRVVGADIWRRQDQWGNAIEATRHNAVVEGVADRVELHTANRLADVVDGTVASHPPGHRHQATAPGHSGRVMFASSPRRCPYLRYTEWARPG